MTFFLRSVDPVRTKPVGSWTVPRYVRPSCREQIDVVVLDAHYRQALAVMRSLGHSGINIGAVACRSEAEWAPAFKSHWCRLRAVVPDFADGYVDGVVALLDEFPAQTARSKPRVHLGAPREAHRGGAPNVPSVSLRSRTRYRLSKS